MSNGKELVSIIIPIYNGEAYLLKTINNLLMQTYDNLEFILINDGSSDSSLEICNMLAKKDSRIIVANKKNGGPSNARNLGLELSKGEYIVFSDSDDYLDTTYIETVMKIISKEKYDFVTASISNVIYNNNGKLEKTVTVGLSEKTLSNNTEVRLFYLEGIINSYTHVTCAKLYKKSIIKNNNLKFNENLDFGEDLLFNLNYISFCQSGYNVSKSFYEYMQVSNPNRLTQKLNNDKFEVFNILSIELDKFVSNLDILKISNIISAIKNQWFISGVNSIVKNMLTSKSEKYKIIKQYINIFLNYTIITREFGFNRFFISLIVKTKSIRLIYFFSKFVLFFKEKFKTSYYEIISN